MNTFHFSFALSSNFLFYFSDVINRFDLQAADYILLKNRKIQKFGDIVPLANGRLEINEYGHFVITETEENCIKICRDDSSFEKNLTAFWMVEKIRHRDEARGHRFELKVTIMPVRRNRLDNRRESVNVLTSKARSFLIKDQDYPKYFEDLHNLEKKKRKRMEKRLFDTRYDNMVLPFHLNYRQHAGAGAPNNNLNIGEYLPHPFGFHNPFDGPALQQNHFNEQPNLVPNFNPLPDLHHHYFLNNRDVPIFKATVYEKENIYPTAAVPTTGFPANPEQYQTTSQLNEPVASSPTPVHFPDQDNPLLHLMPPHLSSYTTAPYEDNRNPFDQHKFNTPTDYGNNLLSLPPRSNSPAYQVPYQFVSSPSPPSTSTGFYNTQNDPSLNNYRPPLFQSQYYQPQLYPGGGFDLRYASTPQSPFEGSFPYQDNTFSELDPIYHSTGIPVGVTPVNLGTLPSAFDVNNNPNYGVSQLPLQNTDLSSPATPENHQKLRDNGETNFTTPFNVVSSSTQSKKQGGKESYPDSINAQLPPPDIGTDLTVPYVDASDVTQKSVTPKRTVSRRPLKPLPRDQTDANSNNDYVTTESQMQPKFENPSTKEKKQESVKPSSRYRPRQSSQTTEKPVLKWVPKGSQRRQRRPTTTRATVDTARRRASGFTANVWNTTETGTTTLIDLERGTESFVTLTPVYSSDEPRTSQSVKKSVSIQVGETSSEQDEVESPFLPTVPATTTTENFSNSATVMNSTSTTRLKWIKSDKNKRNGKIVDELTTSIVKRARRL